MKTTTHVTRTLLTLCPLLLLVGSMTTLRAQDTSNGVNVSTNQPGTPDASTPLSVYVFANPSAAADAVEGLTDSVSDVRTAVAENPSGKLRLVETLADADITIEVTKRKRELFMRQVWVQVHYRGGAAQPLHRYSTQGGFAILAEEVVGLVDTWSRNLRTPDGHYRAQPPSLIPLQVYGDLRSADSGLRATAASLLGTYRGRTGAADALVNLLADVTPVTRIPRPGTQERSTKTIVGVVAARALANLGAHDELFTALASDSREAARINAVYGVFLVDGDRAVDALAAAARADRSGRVRKAAAGVLASRTATR